MPLAVTTVKRLTCTGMLSFFQSINRRDTPGFRRRQHPHTTSALHAEANVVLRAIGGSEVAMLRFSIDNMVF